MVGVAGRSKACHTCRQRAIKCDSKKPQCGQCIKSKRVCAGYQREMIFVETRATPDESQRSGNTVRPETLKALAASRRRQSCQKAPTYPNRRLVGGMRWEIDGMPLKTGALLTPQYKYQLLNAFLSAYIPEDRLGTPDGRPWLMKLPAVTYPTKALEVSTLALCTARLARLGFNETLLLESKELYVQGLKELQCALWDPPQMYKDETLAACMNLNYYEIVECPSETKHGYLSHQDGLATLIRLRGAEAHDKGIAHNIFCIFRVQAILSALQEHRPTFLSLPEWTQLPWKSSAKSHLDKLLDCFSEAPEFYLAADQLQGLELHELIPATLDLIDRCWKLDKRLQQVFADFEKDTLGPVYTPALAKCSNSVDEIHSETTFPVAFHFPNLRMASVSVWYWSISILLWSGMTALYKIIDGVTAGLPPGCACPCHACAQGRGPCLFKAPVADLPPLGEERKEYLSLAWNVCQSFEYCMQDCMLGLGPVTMAAPLHIILEQVKNHPDRSRELAWIQAALQKVKERGMRYIEYE